MLAAASSDAIAPSPVAQCRQEKSTAAEHERPEHPVTFCRVLIYLHEQPLRPANVTCRKQGLDPGRARQPGVVHVELLDVVEKVYDLAPARGSIVEGKLEHRECSPQAEGRPSEPGRLHELK